MYYVGKSKALAIPSKLPLADAIELGKQKILSRVDDATGCWLWTGHLMSGGYAEMFFRGKLWRVHRLAYWFWKGEFDLKLDICHTCDIKRCVNPDHLWLGTHRQNMIDHVEKGRHYETKKTHCLRGHPLSGDNIVWHNGGPGRNKARRCVTCNRYRQTVEYRRERGLLQD